MGDFIVTLPILKNSKKIFNTNLKKVKVKGLRPEQACEMYIISKFWLNNFIPDPISDGYYIMGAK